MNFITARAIGLLAACSVILASCESAGGLRGDPGFTPAEVVAGSGLPEGLDFDAASLTAAQCSAWLDQKLPKYIWHGEEKDFTLMTGRVIFAKGKCRQYRVFNSETVRTWHLREIPVSAVTAASFGKVVSALNAPAPDQNHYFEVTGPWTRRWETWDLTQEKRTASGSVKAQSVTLHFTTRAAAEKARAVMLHLATLLQQERK